MKMEPGKGGGLYIVAWYEGQDNEFHYGSAPISLSDPAYRPQVGDPYEQGVIVAVYWAPDDFIAEAIADFYAEPHQCSHCS